MSQSKPVIRPMRSIRSYLTLEVMTCSLDSSQAADSHPLLEAAPVSIESSNRIRLLVVDDDSRVRAALLQTIAPETDLIVVADAAHPTIALALAARSAPSVALVDVLLPDEAAGLELVGQLSRRSNCAVVAMSVRSGLRHAALAAGASAFVEKGSDIDAILAAVRMAARGPSDRR